MVYKIPGIRKLTTSFWRTYISMITTWFILVIVFGSFSISLTMAIMPNATLFIVLSIVGVITHFSAFMLRDLWTGKVVKKEIQNVRRRPIADQVAMFGAIWVYTNCILLGAAAIATMSTILQIELLAPLLAIYIPVVDFYLARKIGWSPGNTIVFFFLKVLVLIGFVRAISVRHLPLIGQKNRPRNFV